MRRDAGFMAGRIRSFHSVPAGETHVLVRLHRETSTWGTASRQHPYIVASRRADRECRTQYTEHSQRKYRTSPFALRNASTSKPHTFSPALPPGTERRHHTCELVCDLSSRQLQTPQLLALHQKFPQPAAFGLLFSLSFSLSSLLGHAKLSYTTTFRAEGRTSSIWQCKVRTSPSTMTSIGASRKNSTRRTECRSASG